MASLEELASALGISDRKKNDWTALGYVTAKSGSVLTVNAMGSTVEAADFCGASVGDVVHLNVSNGQMRAIAVKGGSGGETYSLSNSGGTITLTGDGGTTSSITQTIDDFKAPFIYVNQATSGSASRAGNSTGSVTVNLTAPSGFKIAHVLSVASNGGIVPAYVADSISALTGQTSKTVTIWWHNGLSGAQTCSFTVRYLCVRNGFLTTNGTTTL